MYLVVIRSVSLVMALVGYDLVKEMMFEIDVWRL